MRKVLAVYQKELGQYFRSPIAYFAVAVFLIGTGYFFTYNIFLTGISVHPVPFTDCWWRLAASIPTPNWP
jgi:ABC-type transport system involved in multi-copper enzyme maturation permease subunit